MSRRERAFAVLPTLLTLGNAFCGFAAITYSAKVGPDQVQPDESHLLVAAFYIFFAMLFDVLDGAAARWTNQTSDFGAQLDSLCDAVSFGVAPAFLMLQFMLQFAETSMFHPRILWVIAALFAVCAILRLARFNVETEEEDSHAHFSGLPSPAAAGAVASFPIAMYGIENMIEATNPEFVISLGEFMKYRIDDPLPVVTLSVSWLIVSRIRYNHVFNQLLTGTRSRGHVIQLVFTVAVVFIVRELAVPLIFCYFAFASPLRALWQGAARRRVRQNVEA